MKPPSLFNCRTSTGAFVGTANVIKEVQGLHDFTTYNTEDGLPSSNVSRCFRDRQGNLWFGTNGCGICRFDGKKFAKFTVAQGLAHNSVRAITQDADGNMWFGTRSGGLTVYNGHNFTSYNIANSRVASNDIRDIMEDSRGNMWICTYGGGVQKFNKGVFENFALGNGGGIAKNNVRCVAEDHNKNIWFGTEGAGAYKYDGLNITHYNKAQGLADSNIFTIAEDINGQIWLGTDGKGVSRFDGYKFTNYTTHDGLAGNKVFQVIADSSGEIWFCCSGGGISRSSAWDTSAGYSFYNFSEANGLNNNNVWSLTKDRTGKLWIGSNGGGVCRYNGPAFVKYTSAQGSARANISCIMKDTSGNLWFGSDGKGVFKYDGRTVINITEKQGLGNNTIWSLEQDAVGDIWCGSRSGGIWRFNGHTFTNYQVDTSRVNNGAWALKRDRAGRMWAGTNARGVLMFDGRQFLNYRKSHGLPFDKIWCINQDSKGNMWFGTDGGGACRFDGKRCVNIGTRQGIVNDHVYCIEEDLNGNIWLGTENGLSMLTVNESRREDEVQITVVNYDISNGLPDNFVRNIVVRKDGRIVVSTNDGIAVINASDRVRAGLLPKVEIYNKASGWPVKDINPGQYTMFQDNNEVIWAAISDANIGLLRFNYSLVTRDTTCPELVIEQLKIDQKEMCWHCIHSLRKQHPDAARAYKNECSIHSCTLTHHDCDSIQDKYRAISFDSVDQFFSLPRHLLLPYRFNNVTFTFNSVDVNRNNLVQYRYLLDGYSKDWSPPLKTNEASFGNIPEGKYTFFLMARSSEGKWSKPVSFSFAVSPPWYRTPLAYLAYIVIAIAIPVVIMRIRLSSLKRQKKKLTAEVKRQTLALNQEKEKSEALLLNILPRQVAEELKLHNTAKPRKYEHVTVLFTDFKGFTSVAEKITPEQLVEELNECFSRFDQITSSYGIERIKTIGDAYMAVCGLPDPVEDHAKKVVCAALDIRDFIEDRKKMKRSVGEISFDIRIGINSGRVVAGIVGTQKYAYDIWGDTVNTASRLESSGEIGKVNISAATHALVQDAFECTFRGNIEAKGKGAIDMYFVDRKI
ncbi:MAG: hypothetical protein KF744_04345 [Taibaiella sp.]|nr:hypothetical protein [Taibaiella sp.]